MNPSDLNEWLALLETRHSKVIDMGLPRVRTVAVNMGLLKPRGRVVTVAGTNGKGSCVKALEQLLMVAGKSVGAYTSPHLVRYNERIRINGAEVDDRAIIMAFEAIEQARAEISLSFFEMGTLAAFWLMSYYDVDVWVLEVGLGGRFDAVNIIDADVSVVTSISVDHVAYLGSDRAVIAKEKLGVARSGRPLIVAELDLPDGMREHADWFAAQWLGINEHFGIRDDEGYLSSGLHFPDVLPKNLPQGSLLAACQAFECLGYPLDAELIKQAYQSLSLPGRLSTIEAKGRRWLLDVGHNPAAAEYLVKHAQTQSVEHVVIGMLGDKDVASVVKILNPHFKHWYVATPNGQGREIKADAILPLLQSAITSKAFLNVKSAINGALAETQAGDTIMIVGSFFTVGEAMSYLECDVE